MQIDEDKAIDLGYRYDEDSMCEAVPTKSEKEAPKTHYPGVWLPERKGKDYSEIRDGWALVKICNTKATAKVEKKETGDEVSADEGVNFDLEKIIMLPSQDDDEEEEKVSISDDDDIDAALNKFFKK